MHQVRQYVPFVYNIIMLVMNRQARRVLKRKVRPPAGR